MSNEVKIEMLHKVAASITESSLSAINIAFEESYLLPLSSGQQIIISGAILGSVLRAMKVILENKDYISEEIVRNFNEATEKYLESRE